MAVSRFGISIEHELLEALDEYVVENNFANRSQAIRQLINKNIFEPKWQCGNTVSGSLTIIYSKPKSDLLLQLASCYENFAVEILSNQRNNIDNNKTLEIIALKGTAKNLTQLSDKISSIKGIQFSKLTMTRTE